MMNFRLLPSLASPAGGAKSAFSSAFTSNWNSCPITASYLVKPGFRLGEQDIVDLSEQNEERRRLARRHFIGAAFVVLDSLEILDDRLLQRLPVVPQACRHSLGELVVQRSDAGSERSALVVESH